MTYYSKNVYSEKLTDEELCFDVNDNLNIEIYKYLEEIIYQISQSWQDGENLGKIDKSHMSGFYWSI